MKKIFTLVFVVFAGLFTTANAQRFLTDMMDTTTKIGKGIYPLYQQHDRLRFGGYMQPQYQFAESKGVKNYSGGDFSSNADNRFMLRRGRFRIDYMHFSENDKPLAFFAFQFDGTERGVAIRDFWGRFYENKLELFAVTAGMFARPMGFEANYSSSDREAPERGRMSQILMKTERDVGMMLTVDSRKKKSIIKNFKADIGIFNGQGLTGPGEYDNHKDIVSRISLKPYKLNKQGWTLSASASAFFGGISSQSAVRYDVSGSGNGASMVKDSSSGNINSVLPRKYYGADAQLKIPNKYGYTEFRAEYITGQQTATANTTETPGTYPLDAAGKPQPLYTRPFAGAYLCFVTNIFSNNLQAVVKYDWYDPNTKVKGKEVNPANGFTAADVRYNTLGFGFVYYVNVHVKATLWYDWIKNEETLVTGYQKDIKDNILTCRIQYRF